MAFFAMLVFPGTVGAVATAQDGSSSIPSSRMDAVAWMGIRDSSGVPLADYLFVTDEGSLLEPGSLSLWALLGLEFAGYMIIVTTAIWFIGYALSFRWLDVFAAALHGVANALADQIATPVVLVTAATIGAFFVAWFVIRGFYAKAAMQTVTMVAVAILGAVFLADPLADAVSSDGLLAKGRDLGITVAAGLDGNGNAHPDQLVGEMQAELADGLARYPLQVWNFGHVIDEQPACAHAWSVGLTTGDTDRVKSGIEACGDLAASAKTAEPTAGQLGTGLLLLLSATVLLAFAVVLGGLIIRAGMSTIYHAFLAVFGFAAGGFVYGPSQTLLIRNLVEIFLAAAKMCAYTVFLGVYLLFLGNLFRQASGQVMPVIVIAALVELVAIVQLWRLSRGMSDGSSWITSRFARAVQGRSGSEDTAAVADANASGAGISGVGILAWATTLNTVNSSPLTAWLAGRTVNPLNPLARGHKASTRADAITAPYRVDEYLHAHLARQSWLMAAVQEAGKHGGIGTELGVARALKTLIDYRVPGEHLVSTLVAAGATGQMIDDAMRARGVRDNTRSQNPYGFRAAQQAVATGYAVGNHIGDPAIRAFAAQAAVAADGLVRHTSPLPSGASLDNAFIAKVEQNWDSARALRAAITADEWNSVGRDTRRAIAGRVARDHLAAAKAYYQDPTELHRAALDRTTMRIANLDHLTLDYGLDPWDP
ncbi:hypothetical protein B0T44_09820 [Nocardia donostiensis]|uniref:TrbL/VirB6 plasmid conjugal transfer protein n=2 Tax=Nocardia donostiensis TaxID=1538463 RepID=A0A1W0BDY9_9NOCA|nr:hypothetical protein B0T46_13160 [Nocardia donostiensis]OQS20571.1 hypothetical protein B0T44_09820 [Nocardia donostiensis]